MKRQTLQWLGILALGTLGLGSLVAHQVHDSTRSHLHGTSIFHRFLHVAMTYENQEDQRPAVEWPRGTVSVRHNAQGRANNQRFQLRASRLEPESTHHLFAYLGDDDTNAQHLASFESSRFGTASLHFRKIGSSRGGGHGHERFMLPGGMDPVDHIRELVITDEETNVVLRADLDHPHRLHYLVRRELDNAGDEGEAEGVLLLRANHRFARLNLHLGGLVADEDYTLYLNDEALETHASDEFGRISVSTELLDPDNVLLVHTLEVRDAEDNLILSTDLRGP